MYTAPLFAALLLHTTSVLSAPLEKAAPDFVFNGDAPYGIPTAQLSSIMTCAKTPNAKTHNVLLVHGTGSTGIESWGDGYVPGLTGHGYNPCYIDLPNRAMNDMQDSSAYIAYNMHYLSAKAGGQPITVISHSQGGPDVQWALRFWPSTRSVVKNFVALSPDFSGVDSSSPIYKLCTLDLTNDLGVLLCTESLWQQGVGSNYLKALNHEKGTFVPTTTIWSQTDGTVLPPQKNAALPGGATTVPVQQLCPKSTTNHIGMLVDYAAFLLALNAIKSGGQANVAQVASHMPNNTCSSISAPGMTYGLVPALTQTLGDVALGILLTGPKTRGEPPVKEYAQIQNQ